MSNLIQSPTELGTHTLVFWWFETQRLAGSRVKRDCKQLWRGLGEEGWPGAPKARDNAACLLMWEFRSLAWSATVRQFPRAEPQKQKYVHMVSICLSGETLILSCHQVAEMPALSHPGMLRFARFSTWAALCLSSARTPNPSLACGISRWRMFSDLALIKYVSAFLHRYSQPEIKAWRRFCDRMYHFVHSSAAVRQISKALKCLNSQVEMLLVNLAPGSEVIKGFGLLCLPWLLVTRWVKLCSEHCYCWSCQIRIKRFKILICGQQFSVKLVQELQRKQYFSLALNSIEKMWYFIFKWASAFQTPWAKAA